MELLLLISIIFMLLSLLFFDKDIFHPAFLYFVGFTISGIFALYNLLKWNYIISFETQICFCVSWLSFFLGCLFAKGLIKRKCFSFVEIETIKVDRLVCWFFIIVNLLITFLLYRKILSSLGLVSSQLSNGVNAMGYVVKDSDFEFGGLLTQLVKISKGCAFVYSYIFINNILSFKKITLKTLRRNFIFLIPLLIYLFQCLIKGSRFTMLAIFIAVAFYYYLLIQKKSGWKYKANISTLLKITLAIIAVMIVFWLGKGAVGRTSELDFFDYISQYIGGSYALLNSYIQQPVDRGIETFSGLVTSLNKIGLTNIEVLAYHEFRFSNTGILLGNAYSAIRNYYHDFGYIGVIIIDFCIGFVFSHWYGRIQRSSRSIMPFSHILYGSLIYTIVFQFFSDYLLARLSIGLFIEVFVMYLIYCIVIRKRLKIRK